MTAKASNGRSNYKLLIVTVSEPFSYLKFLQGHGSHSDSITPMDHHRRATNGLVTRLFAAN